MGNSYFDGGATQGIKKKSINRGVKIQFTRYGQEYLSRAVIRP